MAYSSPASVSTATTIASSWGNSVKAATDFLANPPACRLTHSTTQSISNSSEAALLWDGETYDTDTMHSTSSNTHRITINTAGLYLFTCFFGYPANATGERLWRLRYKGSTPFVTQEWDTSPSAGQDAYASISAVYKCAATDWFDVSAFQTSGGALAVPNTRAFTATWIGLG